MLTSMTGFGRGEHTGEFGISVTAEIRSVNSRFLETSVRLPRTMSEREFEVREIIRKGLGRGKINLNVTITSGDDAASVALTVNEVAARGYFLLLDKLRTVAGVTAEITLRDLTSFNDVFISDGAGTDRAVEEWNVVQESIRKAIDSLNGMRQQEGAELEKDFRNRIANLESIVTAVEQQSKDAAKDEYTALKQRVAELIGDSAVLNSERLELEIALLAERLDITEEIVRFRSHIKFFLEALESKEPSGRKLNFLLQEMNREINTMGSKSTNAAIAHVVVGAKEEMEKIREQVQNIE